MSENGQWDHSVDVVVVGSGNGGMTAALCCYEMGCKDVLTIEKSDLYGGTSSTSGGGVWIPNNRYAKEAGANDSAADAAEYLKNTIPDYVPEDMVATYLEEGPKMIDFMHERTRMRYENLSMYPDYYTDRPGGKEGNRSMEPSPMDISELKDWEQLRPTHHMMYMFDRISMTQQEAHKLVIKEKGWMLLTMKLIFKHLFDFGWVMKDKRFGLSGLGRCRRLACGSAGVGRLRWSMQDRNMPLWLNTAMKELITDDNGKVIGITASKEGKEIRIEAKNGVILAAGGFEANQEMREKYLPKPTNKDWSAAPDTNTGDAHVASMAIGAATQQMDQAWWAMSFDTPGEPRPRLAVMEQSLPGSCVVNKQGKRIANESQNYMAYLTEYFSKHSEDTPCWPNWFVFDRRFRESYLVGPLLDNAARPDSAVPKEFFDTGFLTKADTIEELAEQAGIDKAGLTETINNMNRYAETGKDEEFGRGDTAYDRYYGDETITPNPCLAPLAKPPFYAMRIQPGDFGTRGGMVTNSKAQVLKEDGSAIDGLYAIGNCSAAILPTYPGPGATLGPAMTFGYLAAKDICNHQG
jgi:3-oxosteroid 1-dehydrogenase